MRYVNYRISEKRLRDLVELMGTKGETKYELVKHEMLSGRGVKYKYSVSLWLPKYTSIDFETGEIITKSYQTGWRYEKTVIEKDYPKNIHPIIMRMLNDIIEENNKKIKNMV